MTEIYLIRHTQAEGNLYRMMQGHWDGDVTDLGWQQIDALAGRFRDVEVDAVYSSDLFRTRMTAGAVLKHHPLELNTDVRLREINMGPWETRYFGDVTYESPALVDTFIHDSDNWHLDGAETFGQVKERAYEALRDIARVNDGKTIAVVSHGVTIRCLLSKIKNAPLNDPEAIPICGNTSVTKLSYDPEADLFSIEYINDMSHLEQLKLPHWSLCPELRTVSFVPGSDRAYYISCYEDAWLFAHNGSRKGLAADIYYLNALNHYAADNDSVVKLYYRDEPAGLVDLDPERGADAGYGWISLLYLNSDFRGKGCGAQAFARALNFYRDRGRASIRLNVSSRNTDAIKFYEKTGFKTIAVEQAASGPLLLMEYTIRRRD